MAGVCRCGHDNDQHETGGCTGMVELLTRLHARFGRIVQRCSCTGFKA